LDRDRRGARLAVRLRAFGKGRRGSSQAEYVPSKADRAGSRSRSRSWSSRS
jgi:hypothetical protein